MSDFTFIIIIVIIFAIINFFDYIFRSCMFFPYIMFLQDSGITIKPFGIIWETNRFNRKFKQLSHFKPAFLRSWFQVGANISVICMMPTFFLVAYSFWQSLNVGSKLAVAPQVVGSKDISYQTLQDINTPIIMPIIPGFTIPLSQMYFFAGSLFVCVVIHEMGHAIAACRENITIEACGIALYGIIPLAYVRLPNEQLQQLPPKQRLRIYSAGVWHNLVLVLFALFLMWTNQITLRPAFKLGQGVTAVDVKTDSAIGQAGGLAANDEIFNINGCEVKNINSWEDCLRKFQVENNQGFCASSNFVKLNNIKLKNKNISVCCPESTDHLCFQDMDTETLFCLPGRKLAEKSSMCFKKGDCGDELCLKPIFQHNSTRLLKIERNGKPPVLYVGYISDLQHSVTVNAWTARFGIFSVQYVEIYETILVYIVTFSCGLAIMNLIPCYGFDGAHLIETVVHFYLLRIITNYEYRRLLINLLNFLGLFMCLGILIYGIFNAVY